MLVKRGLNTERKGKLLGEVGPKPCAPTESCQERYVMWFFVSHFAIVSCCLLTLPGVAYWRYLRSDSSFYIPWDNTAGTTCHLPLELALLLA